MKKAGKTASGTRRVRDYVAERGWSGIGASEWAELCDVFSESMIRGAGIPIEAPWSGVLTHTLVELEESLREYSRIYDERPDLRGYCRDQVIEAKERARWASKSSRVEESKRRLKAEMVEWMLVWLGDPATFPVWARLRRDVIVG